jgi:hypothetical protein
VDDLTLVPVASISVSIEDLSLPTTMGAPHLARFSRDVGYHRSRLNVFRAGNLEGRPVTSHISRKTSEMPRISCTQPWIRPRMRLSLRKGA